MTSITPTPAEQFLANFHDQHPGITSRAFDTLIAKKGVACAASSYEFLASRIDACSEPLSILDVACGDGYLLSLLASRRRFGLTLTGIDISRGELAAASERLGANAKLIQSRAQELPLPDGTQDFVFCHMALMLMDDLDRVIGEVRRVLKPNGVFSFIIGATPPSSPAFEAYVSRLRAARLRHPEAATVFGDRRLNKPEQIRELLALQFAEPLIEDILITRDYSAAELWAWFEGMYDLHMLPPGECQRLKEDYLEVLSQQSPVNGRIEFTDCLRQVSAMAV